MEEIRSVEQTNLDNQRIEEEVKPVSKTAEATLTPYMLEESGIPKRLWNPFSPYDHFSPEEWRPIGRWLGSWGMEDIRVRADNGLFLYGDVAFAEVIMAYICRVMLVKKRKVYCISAAEVTEQCQDEERYIYLKNRVRCLAVYNFPVREHNFGQMTFLEKIIAKRHDNLLPTVFVSNYMPSELPEIMLNSHPSVVRALTGYTIPLLIKNSRIQQTAQGSE